MRPPHHSPDSCTLYYHQFEALRQKSYGSDVFRNQDRQQHNNHCIFIQPSYSSGHIWQQHIMLGIKGLLRRLSWWQRQHLAAIIKWPNKEFQVIIKMTIRSSATVSQDGPSLAHRSHGLDHRRSPPSQHRRLRYEALFTVITEKVSKLN